jgi:CBS domain containing-hemolysin-like protein
MPDSEKAGRGKNDFLCIHTSIMTQGEILIYIVVSILLSAFFSGMEIAFVSANRLKIELDKKQGSLSGRINSFFASNPTSFLGAMLIGNNIVLVLYGIFFAGLLQAPLEQYLNLQFGWQKEESEETVTLIQTLASTAVILVTGEYLPKTLFRINPNKVLNVFAIPAILFYWLLFPVGKAAAWISESILRIIPGYTPGNEQPVFGRPDLDNLLREATDDSARANEDIDHEFIIMKNALEFEHTRVRDCMVHRTEIEAVEINTPIDDLRQKFVETGLSKILIYEEDLDNIIGYVHLFALFKKPTGIRPVMITPLIVPESMQVKELLSQFIGKHKSMALVVNEFGGTAGILTIEDVMEEIFGEIEDEHDSEELTEIVIAKNEYRFSGRLEVKYLNDKYKLRIPETEDYNTLAGFVTYEYESLPEENEVLQLGDFEIQILARTGGKIDEIKLKVRTE